MGLEELGRDGVGNTVCDDDESIRCDLFGVAAS
jgi:hypothetical protein